MHVGNARTALYAYLFASKNNGTFVLRIEDTDQDRLVEGSVEHIQDSLKWLGVEWQEGPDVGGEYGPYKQSQRLERYKEVAQKLVDEGLAYPEIYSKEQIQEFRDQAKAEKRPFLYRKHRPEVFEEWNGATPLRLKVDPIERKEWHDEIRGDLSAGEDSLDDFILMKADGFPTYNFAHIVDDNDMRITHVVRGEEFLSSMPKFIALYEALDYTPPKFITAPPILNKNGGKKLSKRDGARDVLEYRQLGYLPAAINNFLATLGWSDGTEQEIFTESELKESFDIMRIQSSGAKFDEERLTWISGHHIRAMSTEELYAQIDERFWPDAASSFDDTYKKAVLGLVQERLKFFSEIDELTRFFFEYKPPEKELLSKKLDEGQPAVLLAAVCESLSELSEWNEESIEQLLRSMVVSLDIGAGKLFRLVRVAVVGGEIAPGLFETIALLGRDHSLERLRSSIEALDGR